MAKKEKLTRDQRKANRLTEFYAKFTEKFKEQTKDMDHGQVLDAFNSAMNQPESNRPDFLAGIFGGSEANYRRPIKAYYRALGVKDEASSVNQIISKYEKLNSRIDKIQSDARRWVSAIEAEIEKLGGKEAIKAKMESILARFK